MFGLGAILTWLVTVVVLIAVTVAASVYQANRKHFGRAYLLLLLVLIEAIVGVAIFKLFLM